jgi:Helix-turn-helix domain
VASVSTASRPVWTIKEAAERCAVSTSTVRRYREAGRFPNAFKDTAGTWKVPLEDLLAVGWRPRDPTLSKLTELPLSTLSERPPEQPNEQGQTDRIRELEQALALERARNESLERIAALAEAHAADLRMALRMLEAKAPEQPERAHEIPHEPALSMPSEQPMSKGPEQPSEQAELPHEQPSPSLAQPAPRQSWWSRLTGPRR